MASGTADSSVSSPRDSAPGNNRQSDRYIEQQLGKARVQVKLVELCTLGLILVVGVLAFAFLAILVDHWIVEIGSLGRWCLLALLLIGVAVYVVRFLLPLFIKRINPVYAAWTIEQSSPSLKNSLINYLSFRGNDSTSGRLVFNAMRQRAASDLSHVNVDTAVDRGHLIRIGYVVVAMMVALAIYTIFSPKDVFQSVRRVAAPWADIARPSRVEIADVKPGDAEVIYGQHVTISALVSGVDEDEDVKLFFTTDDKQVVERAEIMQQPEGSRRFECTLPSGEDGMRQGLTYRIESGDARTPEYQLRVLPAPTILVDRVDYKFPAYTRLQPKTITKRGDIQALEGTRVTVHARASQPIQTAFIEFDPVIESDNGQRGEVYRLQVDDSDPTVATYSFPLLLADDRRTAQYSSYQLTFLTVDNQRSQNTITHQIHVSRDLPPEISILTPAQDRIEVPENGSQMIEIRAVDPDFGLSRVALRAVATGDDLLDEPLLTEPQGQSGQVMSTYTFLPKRLKLVVGDTVVFWAVAEDNRADPQTGAPDPNSQRTRNYHITIVAADSRGADRMQGEPTPAQSPQPQDAKDGAQGAEQEGQQGEGQEGEGQEGEGSETGDTGGSESGQEGQQTQESQSGQDQAGQGAGQSGSEQQSSDATQDQGGSTQGGSAGTESDSEPPEGQQASGSGGQMGEASEQESPSGQPGSPSADTSQSGSGDPQDMDSASPNGQATQPGQEPSQGQRTEPLHDGEAFEQLLEHVRQQPNDNQDSSTTNSGQQEDPTGAQDSQQPQPQDSPESSGSQNMTEPQDSGGSSSQNQDPSQSGQPSGTDPQQGTGAQPQDAEPGSSGQPLESGSPQEGSDPSQPTGDPSSDSQGTDTGSSSQQPSEGATGQQTGGPQPKGEGRPKGEGESGEGEQEGNPETGSQEGSKSKSGNQPDASQSPDKGSSEPGSDSQGSEAEGDSPGSEPQGSPSSQDQATDQATGEADQGKEGSEGGDQGGQIQPADQGEMGSDSKSPSENSQEGQPPQEASQQEDRQSGDRTGGTSSGAPQGGGLPNETGPDRPEQAGDAPDGEAANLDYARRATDLVLEQLKDDQAKADDELLKKLGWTQEELQAFLRRWETMKKTAREGGREEQAELDDALRSLGLRPSGQSRRRGSSQNDQQRGLRDAGSRSRPPVEFLDKFNAYKKGAARAAGQPRP